MVYSHLNCFNVAQLDVTKRFRLPNVDTVRTVTVDQIDFGWKVSWDAARQVL